MDILSLSLSSPKILLAEKTDLRFVFFFFFFLPLRSQAKLLINRAFEISVLSYREKEKKKERERERERGQQSRISPREL